MRISVSCFMDVLVYGMSDYESWDCRETTSNVTGSRIWDLGVRVLGSDFFWEGERDFLILGKKPKVT